ncbi:hypothetical protein D9758_010764 [Tetrapyrgos nigripes]|uniref:Heme haloperoxidase family profile domain-containing protein n=1 Tax=Tetrapyrgos nigripes TaxID=182062 RepID=A0A8H5FZ87_9AGAR|nr:hypothetical protein D9758_010764 [Tetrapyrgos nigripes]
MFLEAVFTLCAAFLARIFYGDYSGSSSSASPGVIDWKAHQWKAPGPNDLRGPCPGLNTLANHGFLPRDGRNINMPVILEAGFGTLTIR